MGENLILQNPIGGGNKWGGGTETMAALTAGHQQDAGGGNIGWSALTEAVKVFGPAAITQEFSKNYSNGRQMLGGSQQSARRLKYKRWKRKFFGYLWVW